MKKSIIMKVITGVVMLAMALTMFPGTLSVSALDSAKADYGDVSVEEALQMMSSYQNVILLDVRNQLEYASGHITGAKSLP